MNYRKLLPALTILLFTCFSLFAQQRDSVPLTTIINKAVKFTNDYPVEKVYIHFDKPYYAAGDTIWLKAYVTVDQHLPSTLSKVVYVDMYNDQDSLVAALKLPMINCVGSGQIALPPAGFKQGNYRLRAYTTWMLNFDGAYLFNKVITIGNPVDKEVQTNINFGGTSGAQPVITSRIQYKDAEGKPLAAKKIDWRVEASHDVVGKGKGETDANGYLNITLPAIPSVTLSSASLLTVIDLGKKSVTNNFSLKSAAPGKDVQFFPEGGSLILGVPSKIAIKAIKADGLGIDFKGSLVDNTGTEVTAFTSSHAGMGIFALQPEDGKTYKVNISFADGTQNAYNLPRIQPNAIVLAVNNSDADNLSIKMMASEAFYQANKNKTFYIIAQSDGFIKYAAQTQLQSQVYIGSVPKTKFGSGILQVTLFNTSGTPVSERVVFIQRNDQLGLTVNTDKPLYNRRQPVKMTIAAKSGAVPSLANLSVSVIDESKVSVDEDAESTILTSLLLTSDLRGYVEKPNYYFRHNDDKTKADLDLLMLTQGYRRFVYRDIITDKKPPITMLPEQGITISGTLRNRTGLPIFKGNVRLLLQDKNVAMDAITDADGIFKFQNVMVNDSTKVTINARNNINSNSVMLTVDGFNYPTATRIPNLPDERMNIDSSMHSYLELSKRIYNNTHQLKEVVIKASAVPKRLGHLDQPSLTGLAMDPDHVIDGARFKDCPLFINCLQSYALGVTYAEQKFFLSKNYNSNNKQEMAIFVDGLQVDAPFVGGINSADVESVEIFYTDGLSGINRRDQTSGVLVINKKKMPKGTAMKLADLQKLLPPPYIVEFSPRGYSIQKEFYSPKYDPAKPSNIGVDLRSTIYWNPKLVTDKVTGATTVQYFNADGVGSYRAVVEGIDAAGNIGRYVYRYKVQ